MKYIRMRILFITFLLTVAFTAFTQDKGLLQDFTEEEIAERDELNKRSGGLLDQMRSAWSMNDPSKFRYFDILPIPDYTPQRQGGVIVETDDYTTVRQPSSRSSSGDIFERSRKLRSAQIGNTVRRSAERAAEIQAEYERRRAEKRARIEAENRADRERGRREYYNLMGSFHAANAARDRWMATEGIRHLREDVRAMDMASIPQAHKQDKLNIMNGSDMANLLKQQKSGIIIEVVVVERDTQLENKVGESLSNGGELDFFGDYGYSQNNIDKWDSALRDNAFIEIVGTTRSVENEYEKLLLFSKKDFDISALDITTLPCMGSVVLIGDSVVLLDSPNLDIVEWSSHTSVEDIVVCGSRTFGKQGVNIIEIENNSNTEFCRVGTSDFKITAQSEDYIILYMENYDLSIVNRLNVNSKTYDELLRLNQPLDKIVANSNVILALQGNKIVDITAEPKLLYSSGILMINDLCMCPDGLLVATDIDVKLLQSQELVFTFSNSGAKRLWCDGEDIYVQDNEDNLYRYTKIQ